MKLRLTRPTAAGTLSVEEDMAGPAHAITVVRSLEAALSTAERDIASRHAPADPPADHAPVIATGAPVAPPRTGKELWDRAFAAGKSRRVLELGRACGLKAATRRDVFDWTADDVAHVYHEMLTKPKPKAKPMPGRPAPDVRHPVRKSGPS